MHGAVHNCHHLHLQENQSYLFDSPPLWYDDVQHFLRSISLCTHNTKFILHVQATFLTVTVIILENTCMTNYHHLTVTPSPTTDFVASVNENNLDIPMSKVIRNVSRNKNYVLIYMWTTSHSKIIRTFICDNTH